MQMSLNIKYLTTRTRNWNANETRGVQEVSQSGDVSSERKKEKEKKERRKQKYVSIDDRYNRVESGNPIKRIRFSLTRILPSEISDNRWPISTVLVQRCGRRVTPRALPGWWTRFTCPLYVTFPPRSFPPFRPSFSLSLAQ